MPDMIQRARSLNKGLLYGDLVHELADEVERLRSLTGKTCARMECQMRGGCAYACYYSPFDCKDKK